MRLLYVFFTFILLGSAYAAGEGDINDDDRVDIQDLLSVLQHVGRNKPYVASADLNSDGQVNVFDLVQVSRNWGRTYSTGVLGVVAAYSFDEGSGTTTADSSGSNHGTLNGPTWTVGQYGAALSFDGTNDQVSVPESSGLEITGNITMSAWVRLPDGGLSNDFAVLCKGASEGAEDYLLGVNMNEQLNARTQTTSYQRLDAGLVPTNTWTHIAAVYDGNTITGYINAAQIGTVAQTGAIVTNGDTLHIGKRCNNDNRYFPGSIDNVRIYNRALTQAEIQTDMNSPIPPAAVVSGPDTTSPSVSFTAPANAATVSGTIAITASASDESGISGVQFLLNGVTLGAEDMVAPYSISWNTATVANGAYTLTVRARDVAGNANIANRTVTVSNGATVPSTEPQPGAGSNIILQDDFESYVNGIWNGQSAYVTDSAASASQITIPTSCGYAGSPSATAGRCLQIHWPQTAGEAHMPVERTFGGFPGNGVAEYYSFYYRAPGFNYGDGVYPRLGKKHFLISSTPGGRVTNSMPGGMSLMQSNGVKIDNWWATHPGASPDCNITASTCDTAWTFANTLLSDGNWHRFTFERVPESAPAAMDGRVRVWYDGILVLNRPNIGTDTGAAHTVQFASTFNGGSAKDQYEYFDNVVFWYNNPDTTAPARSTGSPNGVLAAGTTSTTLSLTTDEAATCKYSTTSGNAYASMTTFRTTGGTNHSHAFSGLTNGQSYTYSVRCADAANNVNTNDYAITFTVATAGTIPFGADEPRPTANSTIVFRDTFEAYTAGHCIQMVAFGGGPYSTNPGEHCSSDPNGIISAPVMTGWNGSASRVARWNWPEACGEQHYVLDKQIAFSGVTRKPEYFTFYYRAPDFIYATSGDVCGGRVGKKHFLIHSAGPRITHNEGFFSILQSNGVKIDSQWDRYPGSRTMLQYIDEVLTDGNWHRYTYERVPETADGAMDGRIRVWFDGGLVLDRTAGTGAGSANEFQIAGTFNGGSSQNQQEYFDDLVVWYG